MLKRYMALAALSLIVFACNKDTPNTKPTIEVVKVNTTEVPQDVDIVMTIKFTDKEGDLGGGLLRYIRYRLNTLYPITNDLADSVEYQIPVFPKTSTGEIELRIPAGFLNENPDFNDTVSFKMFATDVAGNKSDTITSPTFVEINN